MNLQQRIVLLNRLGEYILQDNDNWQATKQKASHQNSWFTPEFIDLATRNIALAFLQKDKLTAWADQYSFQADNTAPKNVGIVMAGNIPLVGFHDFLCVFISGHRQTIKLSSKDDVLLKHLVQQLHDWDERTRHLISFAEMLKNCDAYIATGSNNSARYFDYYFSKYPHIIRRNRTSVAILTGEESPEELNQLADDVYQYFGLGCRNVTKLYVPEQYDFIPLLNAFKKYDHLTDLHKYKHNYDYILAVLLLNRQYYMANQSILLTESKELFSPISQLNFEYYKPGEQPEAILTNNEDVQCIVGKNHIPFGKAQSPSLTDYADGVDVMKFLRDI
ncbi:acyl-CoA reductase [Niastella populi]|uniref:Acyl-CoA reductase n=1 Tax=Niastella populi TaxID=550983 RepID=A0A1V9F0N8_9BACT|nr:acyl-CoA reductase [Niastella populi]OQP51953.1 acyl-CoA reductase [Niastella populi]